MAALQAALSAVAADHYRRGEHVALVVDTRQQAADLNAAIRERLAAIGRVDDTRTVTTRAVQRIGAGDRLATRRNDRDLGVANRDTWTVTAVGRHGELVVTPAGATGSDVTPAGVTPPDGVPAGVTPQLEGRRVLPADYAAWHVEQAYASTAHGVQGDTVTTAHTVIGEQTGAASAYGMTRGRTANTAHLVSTDLREARKQWIAVFGRDRADLDPAHAAGLAAAEAPATPRPAPPRPLDDVVAELHTAWTARQGCLDRLECEHLQRKVLRAALTRQTEEIQRAGRPGGLLPTDRERRRRRPAARPQHRRPRRRRLGPDPRHAAAPLGRRAGDRPGCSPRGARRPGPVRAAAVRRGPRPRAARRLVHHLGAAPTGPAHRSWPNCGDRRRGRRPAGPMGGDTPPPLAVMPKRPTPTTPHRPRPPTPPGRPTTGRAASWPRPTGGTTPLRFPGRRPDLAQQLTEVERSVAATRQEFTDTQARIATLEGEPALLAQPSDRLQQESDVCRARRDADRRVARPTWRPATGTGRAVRRPRPEDLQQLSLERNPGRGISRRMGALPEPSNDGR